MPVLAGDVPRIVVVDTSKYLHVLFESSLFAN